MSERNESRGRDRDSDRGGRDRSSRDEGGDRSRRSSRDDEDRGTRSRPTGSGRSSSYEYQSRDASEAKKRSSQGANEFDKILVDSVKMFKPNDGDNRMRIVPPTWKGAKHFGLDIYVHYGVGPDRGTYLCLAKMKGEACPICEEREIARRDEDEKYAKELEPKRRVLIYLIDRDHEKEGVQAWAEPWTVDRDIVKVSVDKGTGEVLPIDHPEEGYDVEFEKKGSKDRTEYLGVAIARRSSSLGRNEWLDYAIDNPLPEQLNYFDYEHIAKAFNGATGHKDSGRGRSEGREEPASRNDRGRDEDDRPSRSSSREQAETPSRRGSARAPEGPTWDSIHEMTGSELEDLIDQERLDINPDEAKSDDDLADWICEEMKIKKAETRSSRRGVPDADDSSSRLRDMRKGRD